MKHVRCWMEEACLLLTVAGWLLVWRAAVTMSPLPPVMVLVAVGLIVGGLLGHVHWVAGRCGKRMSRAERAEFIAEMEGDG